MIMTPNLCPVVALLLVMILIFVLIAVFCVLLFNTRPAYKDGKLIRKFNKSGKTEYYTYNIVIEPNATQEDIEFNTADLLFKLAKEISPDSNMYLKVSPKKRILPGISAEVDPSNNTLHVQMKTGAPENNISDEESYSLTCEKLNDNCILMTYTDQNEPTVRNLRDILWTHLKTICGTSQNTDDTRVTNFSNKRKPGKVAKTKPRRQQKRN